jgi:hypothetical protein
MDITDIYRTVYLTAFSEAHCKIDHILEQVSLNKIQDNLSHFLHFINYNSVKSETNSKRKYPNTWMLNNALLNDQWVIKDIRGI